MGRLTSQQRVSLTILVAALGYFVDVFDMQLFAMVRVSSLKSLGLSDEEILRVGAQLLNWQMAGMLIGGILWGMLGDKKGRVSVLFGTILLYSLGNIANAFVTTIPEYAAARFIAGVGLAGELGAGVTLASELLPKAKRGYATTIIVTCGVMGPIAASFLANAFDWRVSYIGGGVLGIFLLILRISVNESGLFSETSKKKHVALGQFRMLFNNRDRFARYVMCILSAVPIWFVVGIIAIFAPELGVHLKSTAPILAPTAVVSCYIGLTLGGLVSGLLSQYFKSRRKVMIAFITGSAITSLFILTAEGITPEGFYALVLVNGFFIGYWTLFMATTAELFGTNLRATATTTASNFVRASIILNTVLITSLTPAVGFLTAVQIDAAICFLIALLALWKFPETFHKDLDFIES